MVAGGGEIRPEEPNVARMYDYMLGGKDNFPADREAVRRTFEVLGEDVVRGTVLQNRLFLGRAVRYLARDLGIRQFLDIGTGLPTMNSVHEVARAGGRGWAAPDSRVVYVDNDPVVIAHARHMLHGVDGAAIVGHDLRDPGGITGDPRVRSILRFDQPIAVLLVAILHFVADADDPRRIAAALMAAVPPGSCLVISHLTADHYAAAGKAAAVYEDASSGLHLRTRAAVAAMFGGLPLVAPGELVWSSQWHPDADTPPVDSPGGASLWCGIARKPLCDARVAGRPLGAAGCARRRPASRAAGGASWPPRRGRRGAAPSRPRRCCRSGGRGSRCRRWWWTGSGG
jgi:S-adenosyl methyltransferase